jgi:RNA polymerase sigma-70 factor (ECF subfamily)
MNTLLECYLGCRRRLTRMVGRIVRPEEIEDIVQEAFITSYAAARTQDIRDPQAFMMRVARNLALDHVGRAEHRLNCSLEELSERELLRDDDTALHCQSQERFLAFCRAVATLPLCCRRVFILKKVYGLSLNEIGEHLDLSVSTVEKHVAKGLALVMAQMMKQGHAEDGEIDASANDAPQRPGRRDWR